MSDAPSGDNDNGTAPAGQINYEIPGWQSGLPQAYRGNALLKGMDVPGKLFEAYRDSHEKLSKLEGKSYIPGKDATAEEWATYRKTMGVPDSKDGYVFEIPEVVDKSESAALVQWFKDVAFEEGLPAETTKRLFSRFMNDNIKAREEQHKAQREQMQAKTDELKKKYGEKWSERVENARTFVKEKLGDAVYEDMVQKNLFDNPVYLDSLAGLHSKLGEDSLPGGGGSGGGVVKSTDGLRELFPTMFPKGSK